LHEELEVLREIALLQRELRELLVGDLDAAPDLDEIALALAELELRLVVAGALGAEPLVGSGRAFDRLDQLFLRDEGVRRDLALLLGSALHVAAQALLALGELLDGAFEPFEGAAIALGTLSRLRRAHLDGGHDLRLLVDGTPPRLPDLDPGVQRLARVLLRRLGSVDLRLRLRLLVVRGGELRSELVGITRELLDAPATALEVLLRATEILLRFDDRDLGVVRRRARGVELRPPRSHAAAQLAMASDGSAQLRVE